MPRRSTGPKLVRVRQGKYEYWNIQWRENGRQRRRSTGIRGSEEAPHEALAEFIQRHYHKPTGPRYPDQITVAEILSIYGNEHAPTVADPARISYAITALLSFWDCNVAAVNKNTCRAYVAHRGVSAGTARRELGTLAAALNYARDEGKLISAPNVHLPPKPAPKDRWLTRIEAAALLRAARGWYTDPVTRERRQRAPHLPLFIMIALYTGARRGAILELRWTENTEGGWVDLDSGIIDFNPIGRAQTKKNRPVIAIPRKLNLFLRYAKRRSVSDHVIAVNGTRVLSVKRSFGTAVTISGIPHTRPHDLRHTAASWIAQSSKVTTRKAAKYLGMSESTFENTYAKHDPHRFDEVLEVFG